MNFLMRSTTGVSAERSPVPEPRVADTHQRSASGSSLESLLSQRAYARNGGSDDSTISGLNSRSELPIVPDKHLDVSAEEGWIMIPCNEFLFWMAVLFCYLRLILLNRRKKFAS